MRPLLRPDELFLDIESCFIAIRGFGRYALREPRSAQSQSAALPAPGARAPHSLAPPDVAVDRRAASPLAKLADWLQTSDQRVLILAESAGRRETLSQWLTEHGISLPEVDDWAAFARQPLPRALGIGPLSEGFRREGGDALVVLTEAELFTGTARRGSGR
ncbi:MAG: transcription-repair coupling factor, partial [Betaproteobacteria bacterium]